LRRAGRWEYLSVQGSREQAVCKESNMVQRDQAFSVRDMDAKFRIKNITKELADSDAMMIRALEDLIIVLLNKKIIGVNEVHPMVVEKIKHRRKLREEMKAIRDRLEDNPRTALKREAPAATPYYNEETKLTRAKGR
jgi:hypothetical protein